MTVRIFWIHAMERMCAQTRPWFILWSERVLGNGVRIHVNSKGKISCTGGSEGGQTHDAASDRTASPTHYQLSCFSPSCMHNGATCAHLHLHPAADAGVPAWVMHDCLLVVLSDDHVMFYLHICPQSVWMCWSPHWTCLHWPSITSLPCSSWPRPCCTGSERTPYTSRTSALARLNC